MEKLIAQINEYCNLSKEEESLLQQTIKLHHFPKGTAVIEAGQINDSIYFIREGIWRAYIERDGEPLILWFAVPGEAIFSPWGYTAGMPARCTISSSTNSTALELKKSTVDKLTESSPGILKWLNKLLLDIILVNDDAMIYLSNTKAEDRYLTLMRKMPEIFRNVPLKELARLIGVTPQSLSRIRAGLGKKK